MKMRKLLALLLALVLCVSLLAGCGQKEDPKPAEEPTGEDTEEPSGEDVPMVEVEYEEYVKYPEFDMGELTIELGTAEGGEIGHDVFAGTAGKDYTDEAQYTFNDYIEETNSMNWNPVSWETNSDSYVLDYLSIGFYDWVLNSNGDGWSIIPEMAADYPVDVTADYVGQFGVAEGETGKAWKIALNEAATWEDGTPINADTYIYSYQQLLDPAQLNRRADSLYAGDFQVVGAKEYFYNGQEALNPIGMTAAEWLEAGNSIDDLYVDAVGFWNAGGYVDAEGNEIAGPVKVTDETEYSADGQGEDAFSGASLYAEYLGPEGEYADEAATYLGTMTKYEGTWDGVGLLKTGDYEIVFISTNPIESPEYYVPYNLGTPYLVKEDLYESLKVMTDGKFTTTYGTSQETTASFGPYKLAYFELDKQITFERNENWYGYSDGKHAGQYQTDTIITHVIKEHATRLLAFQNGEIDNVALQQEDMEKYASSDYIRYTPQSYTTKLTWNTDESKLGERGTMVLSNRNFRKGWSLAIDRNTFATSYTAAGSAGYGMLNYMYVYDPFTGATYRDTEPAKAALVKLYGLEDEFDDIDEAHDAITGYDIEGARYAMQLAYEQLKAAGTYNDEDVLITFSVYQSDDIYVKMFNYLNDALQAACEGTGFAGKVKLDMKVDADYYESNYSGACDMIFTTWGGAAYSPYSMLGQVYCDASDGSGNQMEYGFDTSQVKVTMTLNGTPHTHSLQEWAFWMCNTAELDGLNAFGEYDAESRAALFANLEYVYLANYPTTPMYYRNTGSMISQKVVYPLTEYMDMVGFGGTRFCTYNYNDEEWAGVASSLTY